MMRRVRNPASKFCRRLMIRSHKYYALLRSNARQPRLQLILVDAVLYDRTLSFVTKLLRYEIIASIDCLAMAGNKEHEYIARPHLRGELRKHGVEMRLGRLWVNNGDDVNRFVETLAGKLKGGRQSLAGLWPIFAARKRPLCRYF